MTEIERRRDAGIFDEIRKVGSAGAEYWRARDLQEHLGYDRWENFEEAITRAAEACEGSGIPPASQFRETTKLVVHGSGAKREVRDFLVDQANRAAKAKTVEGQIVPA